VLRKILAPPAPVAKPQQASVRIATKASA
jgi:hypothetical protein